MKDNTCWIRDGMNAIERQTFLMLVPPDDPHANGYTVEFRQIQPDEVQAMSNSFQLIQEEREEWEALIPGFHQPFRALCNTLHQLWVCIQEQKPPWPILLQFRDEVHANLDRWPRFTIGEVVRWLVFFMHNGVDSLRQCPRCAHFFLIKNQLIDGKRGGIPRYCSDQCRKSAKSLKNPEEVAAWRERKRKQVVKQLQAFLDPQRLAQLKSEWKMGLLTLDSDTLEQAVRCVNNHDITLFEKPIRHRRLKGLLAEGMRKG